MTTTRVETVPTIWDDARDLPFFRITGRLFSSDFCLGAGVLLASYDEDVVEQTPAGSTAAPAAVGAPAHVESAPVPVRVRRTR